MDRLRWSLDTADDDNDEILAVVVVVAVDGDERADLEAARLSA